MTRLVECPECDGEGYVYREVPGGAWNTYYGTWEPDEKEVECETCNGDGRVEAEDEEDEDEQ